MKIIEGLSTIAQLMQAANILMSQASGISMLIKRAHAEGRDVTPEELDALAGNDTTARAQLADAIAKANAPAALT